MERTLSRSPVHSKHGLSPPPHLDAKRAPARNKEQAWLLILRDNEPSDEADPHITTSDRLERHAHDPRGVARSRRLLPAQGPRLAAREPGGRQFMGRHHESLAFGRRITGPRLTALTANAQTACPPGYKSTAGACVRTCPAGYDDRGQVCVFRSYGGHGGS